MNTKSTIIAVFGLMLASADALAQLPHAAPHPPAPSIPFWATRQMAFYIPFTATVAEEKAPVTEVHLYVSEDGGRNWKLYDRRKTTAREFSYRAARDGEYWFATLTVDTRKPASLPRRMGAQLHVLVDTLEPQLDLVVSRAPSGEILAHWKAFDEHLLPESLKLEYQGGTGQPWTPVAFELSRDSQARTNLTGSTTWYPQTAAGPLLVRAEVRDRAGNLAMISRRLDVVSAKQPPVKNSAPSKPAANTSTLQKLLENGSPADSKPSRAAPSRDWDDPFLRKHPTTSEQSPVKKIPAKGIPWPKSLPADSNRQSKGMDKNRFRHVASPKKSLQRQPTERMPLSSWPSGPQATTPAPTARRAPGDSMPAGERPRMIRSRRFQLDYDVDKVGPSGVGSVELWYTRDNGRSWHSYGFDADRKSPFDVEIESEDVYGFRVVIESGDGLAGHAPQSGDLADLWVAVDWTPPTAQIISAIYGVGTRAGKLEIGWKASDDHLTDRPITLQFSDRPDGPWTTIATGLPNSGSYDWKVDPRTPPRIYLRLEVRDEAANLGVHHLEEPINIVGLAPKGRIRGLRPLEE